MSYKFKFIDTLIAFSWPLYRPHRILSWHRGGFWTNMLS